MKKLYILRGIMGAGKSTYIKNNNLGKHTLSTDRLRQLFASPSADKFGKFGTTANDDKFVFELFFSLIEKRMQRGCTTFLDATHIKYEHMMAYKNLVSKYGYRATIIDFNVPLEEAIIRDSKRQEHKIVGREVIEKYYDSYLNEKIPSYISEIITPNDSLIRNIEDVTDCYDKVIFIGDIHGYGNLLNKYFEEHKFNDRNKYVLCGDYIDRGLYNGETLKLLMKLVENDNVTLLEGNHERWLKTDFFNSDELHNQLFKVDKSTLSEEYAKYTKVDISKAIESKLFTYAQVRNFCRKLSQLSHFKFGKYTYLASHGGILPIVNTENYNTEDIIKGVGYYSEIEDMYSRYCSDEYMEKYNDTIVIHGHRNPNDLPTEVVKNRIYNLEGKIDFMGELRIVEFDKDGICNIVEVSNDEICDRFIPNSFDIIENVDMLAVKKAFTENPYLKIKKVNNKLTSINFSRVAFREKIWNLQTIKARGLFLYEDGNICARSYDKFFNYNEGGLDDKALSNKLNFPVNVYLKENGYLGFISYNKNIDDIEFFTKTTNKGDYALMFKELFMSRYSDKYDELLDYLRDNDNTILFEVEKHIEDPHIIKYKEDSIILLDIVKNKYLFDFLSEIEYNELCSKFGFEPRIEFDKIYNMEDLIKYMDVIKDTPDIEGVVYRDSNGFMFKQKSKFYNDWKVIRGYMDRIKRFNTMDMFPNYRNDRITNIINFLVDKGIDYAMNKTLFEVMEDFNC